MGCLSIVLLLFAVVYLTVAFTPTQRQFQNEALAKHNEYRSKNCVSQLTLDDQLSATAQAYAEYLANTGKFQHSGAKGLGENLYMMRGSGQITVNGIQPTKSWYDEINLYNFERQGFTSGTGHFTQVVWAGTKKLGMGIAYGNDGRSAVVVG
ncbi:unnamed protein product [Didymodactylos carnosus]|uniref:SCP domain-containing protein n=1 Tax=Didymodactylos carnosus TaxID=1234261 RepID=A0A815KN96_9BILA|nr:unnamed protein product [Didymodactylos carnosus]CAF1398550.1 unnamed protein product [Didymodactylos carnosus]CAF4088285.1 unnamed protein product [Didymodactylos carnosus]CAF4292618.1 unnamed protein product [Didymodactylos carnosus]